MVLCVAAVVLLCIHSFGYLVTGPAIGSSVAFGLYLLMHAAFVSRHFMIRPEYHFSMICHFAGNRPGA